MDDTSNLNAGASSAANFTDDSLSGSSSAAANESEGAGSAVDSPVQPAKTEELLLLACKTVAMLCGLQPSPKATANDLLYETLLKRDPTRLLISEDPEDSLVTRALKASAGTTAPRKRDFQGIIGQPVYHDKFLDTLNDQRKMSCCPGSVRQELPMKNFCEMAHGKVAGINIGDIVVYEEKGYRGQNIVSSSPDGKNLVYAAVIAVACHSTRRKEPKMMLHVQRLYQFHELLWIFDQIAPYRKHKKLNEVDFRNVTGLPPDLVQDPVFVDAKRQFQDMREQVKVCFTGMPGMHHKVYVMALSDHETYLPPECVHYVLAHTLCPAMLENVGSTNDSVWPPTWQEADATLCTRNVLWKSYLDTRTWTLHPIDLRRTYMQNIVFSAAGRASAWVPQLAMQGSVGVVRRYIDSRVRKLGGVDGQSRQAVLSVPCSFNLFAFLVASCRAPGLALMDSESVHIAWEKSSHSWLVRVASPIFLESVLGRNWGTYSFQNDRTVEVEGLILMRYSHETPDRMRFTMTKVRFGTVGGFDMVAEVGEHECPDQDIYSP
jgi:hypothetical protein